MNKLILILLVISLAVFTSAFEFHDFDALVEESTFANSDMDTTLGFDDSFVQDTDEIIASELSPRTLSTPIASTPISEEILNELNALENGEEVQEKAVNTLEKSLEVKVNGAKSLEVGKAEAVPVSAIPTQESRAQVNPLRAM